MKLQDFLNHHGIKQNPFSEEDAQTDLVFKSHCIDSTYHPSWDKIFGNPADPSTSIVFGEKGSGKTALRLQIDRHLQTHNREHSKKRCFVIHYDDFNPFLDEFCTRLGRKGRKPGKALHEIQLWDHMDAILSLGVTSLVDAALDSKRKPDDSADRLWIDPKAFRKLDRHQRRDLMLLASCYDNSTAAPSWERWKRLRRVVGFRTFKSKLPAFLGITTACLSLLLVAYFLLNLGSLWWVPPISEANDGSLGFDFTKVPKPIWWTAGILALVGWGPCLVRKVRGCIVARSTTNRMRVLPARTSKLAKSLGRFTRSQLSGQPLPNRDRTDDRYSLFRKLQSILGTLDFCGTVVLVDRVDEPNIINGSAQLMRALIWPMLDNKFLRQSGIGFKFMLPSELNEFIQREDREFYQRARLDKQNMVPSLDWTGEALYDVANARLQACSMPGKEPKLRALVDDAVSDQRMYDVLRSLRVPRHMFRFLHRVFVAHCNKYSEDQPVWQIGSDTFEAELAVYDRSLSAADKGLAVG